MNKALLMRILKYILPALIGSGLTIGVTEGLSVVCTPKVVEAEK